VKKVTPGDPENCALAETDPNVIVGVPYHNVAGSKPECSAMRRGAVKVIAVDDVMPNPKNIRSEAYPVTNYLFMITKGVPDNEEARYLRFLTSDDGQRILAAGGMAVALP
jgi:ABC-type phosphate transport system substrate-binding protein